MPESLVARRPMEESTAATGILGGSERLVDGSAMVIGATTETTESSGAEAGAADATSVFRTEGSAVLEEQAPLPKASEGVVGHAI